MKVRAGNKIPPSKPHESRPTTTETTSVQTVEVDAGHAGQCIDNFLLSLLKGVPKSRIYRMLRTGEVRVNKGRAKPVQRLEAGDMVRIPPVRVSAPDTPAAISPRVVEQLQAAVLYEDEDLLILNKPSGLAVHGGSGVEYGVIEALRQLRPDVPDIELVHRIDRATSGCLMLAKNRPMLRTLHSLIQSGGVDKSYVALVSGRWPRGVREVRAALEKNVLRSGERMVQSGEDGKDALSIFKWREDYGSATLVDVNIVTGRTHQVRVHAAHEGHPLAGDDKYGDDGFNKSMRRYGLKRLFLHAASLTIKFTDGRSPLRVSAPLPDDLRAVLSAMKESHG